MQQSVLKKVIAMFICAVLSFGCVFAASDRDDRDEVSDPTSPTVTQEETTTPLTPEEMNVKEGLEYGQKFGTLDGTVDGNAHLEEGLDTAYYSSMPSELTIITKYHLMKEDLFYRLNFIKAYQDYYEIAYNSAYRSSNLDKEYIPVVNGRTYGLQAGNVEGQAAAMIDIYQNRYSNWERALDEFINLGSLNLRYALDGEAFDYALSFRTAFKEGFFASYYETYQSSKLDAAIRNRTSELVTSKETSFYFEDSFVDFNGGNASNKAETPVRIDIPNAAVYTPTYLSLYKSPALNLDNLELEEASSIYVVAVDNAQKSMFLNKPMKLIFEFNGSENAGIYKLENDKWFYQITELTDDAIYTEIPAGTFTGGEYRILIDPQNSAFTDISFNWAKKEINALKRRGYLSEESQFRPTNFITRLEAAKILYNVYADKTNNTINYTMQDDLLEPDDYKYISYVLNKGYMALDAESKFNPSDTVTYEEVEFMMSSILKTDFKWENIARKMMLEKYKKSRGLESLSRPIFRDEFAYIMYLYDDLK